MYTVYYGGKVEEFDTLAKAVLFGDVLARSFDYGSAIRDGNGHLIVSYMMNTTTGQYMKQPQENI
jgi:hypothetical protein